MPKHHTYVATCIKEAPLQWGIELEALERASTIQNCAVSRFDTTAYQCTIFSVRLRSDRLS